MIGLLLRRGWFDGQESGRNHMEWVLIL